MDIVILRVSGAFSGDIILICLRSGRKCSYLGFNQRTKSTIFLWKWEVNKHESLGGIGSPPLVNPRSIENAVGALPALTVRRMKGVERESRKNKRRSRIRGVFGIPDPHSPYETQPAECYSSFTAVFCESVVFSRFYLALFVLQIDKAENRLLPSQDVK